jgi:zinc transport system substrate-binding protein
MSAIMAVVAHALAAAAPSQADTFASRAKAYEAKLSALDADMRAGLATCERTQIVTAHDAFGWLAKRYHLTQDAITGITPDVEPNPQRLDDLAKLVEAKGVTTIFTETLVSPKVAQLLARETGVTTAVLNPLEGLTKKQIDAGASYISVMRENLATLRRALGCA